MVNIDDFIKRLETILDYYGLSASVFADKIGVQRSSMSHLLSGRNKPSLDFIIKVVEIFPDVDLYWILNGKGSFPKEENVQIKIEETKFAPIETIKMKTELSSPDLFSPASSSNFEQEMQQKEKSNHSPPIFSSNTIERIVIFYTDGTFKNYIP
jgi:transcriptional regulator with XRE-family HTH domain